MRPILFALVVCASHAVADDLILLELSSGQTIAVKMADGDVTVLGVFQTVTTISPENPPEPRTVTQVVYCFEKDQTPIYPGVAEALTELNKRGIKATEFERDTTDGDGQIPEQYKAARQAALDSGLPALVVEYSDGGLVVVDDPRNADEIIDAVIPKEKTDAATGS